MIFLVQPGLGGTGVEPWFQKQLEADVFMGLICLRLQHRMPVSSPHPIDGEPGLKFSLLCLITIQKRQKLARAYGCGLSHVSDMDTERSPSPGPAGKQDAS